jgi:hypothetical protein
MQVEEVLKGLDADAGLELAIADIRQEMERAFADGDIATAKVAAERMNNAIRARSLRQIARMEQQRGLA